ncbi:hypothetical protein AAHC03_013252 [Spirometra sp. Aus1]
MHPTSSTSGKSDLNLAQSFGRLPGYALAAVKIIGTLLSRISCPDCVHDSSISELLLFLQSKVLQVSRPLTRDFTPPKSLLHYGQIALNCLQTRSLPSALEKLAPILEFVVALSNFSGETGTSKPDRNNSPSDSQLPLRLLMVTATIELRLRLSTAMNTTEEPLGDIESVVVSCFKLILLGISELSVPASENKEDLVNSMSDDAVSELFLQLLDFSDLLLESLVSWNSTSSTDTVTACGENLSSTVLGCLATFLRWTVFYMTNHFLAVVDDTGTSDETFFHPQNPSSDEYTAIANRFKNKFWLPVLPIIQRVVPLVFHLSTEPTFTEQCDQERADFLAVCRKSICSLARMFPLVLLPTLDFGTADFVNCFSVDFSSCYLQSTAPCRESLSSQKLLFELMDCLRDLTLLLDTGLSSAESAEKLVAEVGQPFGPSSKNDGQPVLLKDICIPLLGRLFFEFLDAKKQSILDVVLSTRSPPETASEFAVCPACRQYDRLLYCGTLLATFTVLRFLTTNVWQTEMCILLHVASSSTANLEIPDNPMQLIEDFASKLCQMDLDALQLVVGLPSELADCNLPPPTQSSFRMNRTLRTAAQDILRCCQNTCKKNAPFRKTWKAGLTARQPNTRLLFK